MVNYILSNHNAVLYFKITAHVLDRAATVPVRHFCKDLKFLNEKFAAHATIDSQTQLLQDREL
jgi:hypothetical protein